MIKVRMTQEQLDFIEHYKEGADRDDFYMMMSEDGVDITHPFYEAHRVLEGLRGYDIAVAWIDPDQVEIIVPEDPTKYKHVSFEEFVETYHNHFVFYIKDSLGYRRVDKYVRFRDVMEHKYDLYMLDLTDKEG